MYVCVWGGGERVVWQYENYYIREVCFPPLT